MHLCRRASRSPTPSTIRRRERRHGLPFEIVRFSVDSIRSRHGGNEFDRPTSGDYTVIDAIGAVNPVAVGDALSILPANLVSGVTNSNFQNPSDLSQTLISLNFDFVSDERQNQHGQPERIFRVRAGRRQRLQRVSTSSAFARGHQSRGTSCADIGLRAGNNYTGNGGDLRVYQWNGTNWTSQPFTFNPANNELLVAGVTNFSAFVVSQIVPPQFERANIPRTALPSSSRPWRTARTSWNARPTS